MTKKRFAIYARYSSDLQQAHSISDQVDLCKAQVMALGGKVINIYKDEGLSGASMRNRAGIKRLLRELHACDVIIAESLDRLSRDQEDIAWLYDVATRAKTQLIMLDDGEVSPLHIGLKGTMNALFLSNLADKTRRGQMGRVRQGRAGSGRAYGYRSAPKIKAGGQVEVGHREIDPGEAKIVQRIFQEYARGRSATAIARDLNDEGIPAPRGGAWSKSALNGSKLRGFGILNNEIYTGKIVFNKTRTVRHPVTGRRIIFANPKSQWVIQSVPSLRIIDDHLFDEVTKRRVRATKTPLRPLSEVTICGVCEHRMVLTGNPRFYRCVRAVKGACSNHNRIRETTLALEAVKALSRRISLGLSGEAKERETHEDIDLRISRLETAIDEGVNSRVLQKRIAELKTKRDDMERVNLQTIQVKKALVLEKLAEIETRLADDGQYEATLAHLRALIARITVSDRKYSATALPYLSVKPSLAGLQELIRPG